MIKLKSTGHEKSEDFTVEYTKPLEIKKLALFSFSMDVSWYSISEKYNNNKFTIINDEAAEITIPDGNYSVKDINEYLMQLFDDPPVKFGYVKPRGIIAIKLTKGTKINLEKGKFHELIGFENKIYGDGSEDIEIKGKYLPNISKGNDNIYIHCDAVYGSKINQNNSNVIYSFTNRNPPHTKISKEFTNLIYFPTKHKSTNQINMRITNQNGELIDLNNGEVEYNFIPVYEEEDYIEKTYKLLSQLSRDFLH